MNTLGRRELYVEARAWCFPPSPCGFAILQVPRRTWTCRHGRTRTRAASSLPTPQPRLESGANIDRDGVERRVDFLRDAASDGCGGAIPEADPASAAWEIHLAALPTFGERHARRITRSEGNTLGQPKPLSPTRPLSQGAILTVALLSLLWHYLLWPHKIILVQ